MKTLLRHVTSGTGEDLGWMLQVWCPGCNLRKGWGGLHQVGIAHEGGKAYGEQWEWDGNLEAPTISPSLAVSNGTGVVCHSHIVGGNWVYLNDCQHPLAGQTVPLPDLPDWLTKEAP